MPHPKKACDDNDISYVPSSDEEGEDLKSPTSSFLASDYCSDDDDTSVNANNKDETVSIAHAAQDEPPKKRGKKSAPHCHMFNVMKHQSKKKPVFLVDEACTELLNHLESLGEETQCKRIIGSGKLACNCLKVLKTSANFVEAIPI